jgi:hypothetical protein
VGIYIADSKMSSACVLCGKHRKVYVLCRSVPIVVNHVGKEHDVVELENEPDLKKSADDLRALSLPQLQSLERRYQKSDKV